MVDAVEAAVDLALLRLAKGLLEASDQLVQCHPSAANKLARKAYEIGRDVRFVRERIGKDPVKSIPQLLAKPSKPQSIVEPTSEDQRLSVLQG